MSQHDPIQLLPRAVAAGAHGCVDKGRLSTDLVLMIEVVEETSEGNYKDGERGRNRTYNLLIKSSATPVADKEDKGLSPADSGKVVQNPQPPRNKVVRSREKP